MFSIADVQSFVSPKRGEDEYIQRAAYGQPKSLKCPRLSCFLASNQVLSCRNSVNCLKASPYSMYVSVEIVKFLTVSAERTPGKLASHLKSHCAEPKTYAGSGVRVLSKSCTGYMAQQNQNLKAFC